MDEPGIPTGPGVRVGHVDLLPDHDQIAGEYASGSPVGTMRTDLVRNADLGTVTAAADAWASVHDAFESIPGDIESDLDEILSEWEGDDAEQLRSRVEGLVEFGRDIAEGLKHNASVILPYVHEKLGEAEHFAPYPEQCFPGSIPVTGPGSRALTEGEKFAEWQARGGECPHAICTDSWFGGTCGTYYEWRDRTLYGEERRAMTGAMTYAVQAMTIASSNWHPAPQPTSPLLDDTTEAPEVDLGPGTRIPDSNVPPGTGSGGGSGPGTGGMPPSPPPPTGGGDFGEDPSDGVDSGELGPPRPDPGEREEFRDGERPILELPNDDVALHPWLIATIPGDEWERMARSMPPELWERLAAQSPESIPPELAKHAPEHLFDSFPCNDPDWEPPLDPDGNPVPFAVFDPELAEHMTPEMEHAIEDYDSGEGKDEWESQYSEGSGSDGGPSKDVTTRSWYAEVESEREDRDWGAAS